MVRNYTFPTVISIIVVFKFYYCYFTHPLELVTDSLGIFFSYFRGKIGVLMWSMALYT